jgi:hypothetical protein
MKTYWSILFFLSFLLLLSCGGDKTKRYELLGGLRLIGLVADTPETTGGSTVVITPYLSDPDGGGRTLTYSAYSCPDLGIGFGATPSCENNPLKVTLATNQTVTGLTGPGYTGAATSTVSVTIPLAAVLFAGKNEFEQHNGVPYIFTYEVKSPEGALIKSFKRILVSTKATKNSNPSFVSGREILADDIPLTSFPTKTVKLKSENGGGAAQDYAYMDKAGVLSQISEQLSFNFFTNMGQINPTSIGVNGELEFTPINPRPTDKAAILVVVLKDGRGGTAITVKSF